MERCVLADETLFLGKDLLPWLLLAIGGALLVANLAAYLRPPLVDPRRPDGARRERPPLGRVVPLSLVGALVSACAIASLVR